jgi:Trypsin
MKRLLLLVTCVLATLVVAAPASAVKYGTPDVNNEYPWVGLMVAYEYNEEGELVPLWRCTGSLLGGETASLEDDIFLTAGHCVEEPADYVAIWFNYDVTPTGEPGYPDPTTADAVGTPESHPSWSGSLTIPQTSDVGVVYDLTYQNGFVPTEYGQLAPVGYLDDLAASNPPGTIEFTVVGYGLQSVVPTESRLRIRMIGTVSLVNLQSALTNGWNLHYSSNPGLGHGGAGGTCFGDSGGPVIYNDPVLGEIIVAVNSFVLNYNCAGAGFGYRVDTAYAQEFILGEHPAS